MARIRSLKPEHKSHKKLGRRSDRAYRLWVALLTEADDEGRGIWDPDEMKRVAFSYQRVSVSKILEAMEELTSTLPTERAPLVYLYQPAGFPLLYQMHDWEDHQRVDNGTESKFPPPREDSRVLARSQENKVKDLLGSDLIVGSDRRIGSPTSGTSFSPEDLIDLYNRNTPDNCPAVKTLSPSRRVKARKYLAMFPERPWWEAVFSQYKRSKFLQGVSGRSNGHEGFTPDFDWLLSKGKDGTENCVKVYDGRYADGQR